MTTSDGILLTIAGVLGGALNTMGAGGGVIMFLALLITGMPPQVAVATSQTAIPASFLGAIVPTWRHRFDYRPILPAVIAATAGTAVGVWLVSQLSGPAFRVAAPWLTGLAAILLIVQPYLPRVLARRGTRITAGAGGPPDLEPFDRSPRLVPLAMALFAVALYAGAFGGGTGVAILLVFATLTNWTWHEANRTKNAVCLLMSLVCSAAFLVTGLADPWAVVVLMAGQIVGGALGVWVADRLSADTLRRTVAVVTVVGAVAMAGSN
jgi:uncharacterized membrane protein YfcA